MALPWPLWCLGAWRMQSYPSPHQLAAAAAAAAAATGIQRMPYHQPALHNMPGMDGQGSDDARRGRITSETRTSVDELENDEIDSDLGSENDEENANESKKLESSLREMIEKFKPDDVECTKKRPSSGHKSDTLTVQNSEKDPPSSNGFVSDVERDSPTQTEIKIQRPLGLLAQHGLHVKPSGFGKSHKDGKSDSSEQEKDCGQDKPEDWIDPEKEREPLEGEQDLSERDQESLNGLDFSNHLSLMDRRFMPSPLPNNSPTASELDKSASTSANHHWTFEEQFKQLYEMSLDPKRKEFLDDLFSFMQKRGTPVNRIPIMAKQTLDLYELFRLVVSKGGLVEVINKKLWREITKGLNLPSSITSAAFTLRTQYMKYLYPYECEKLKLSSLSELQSAIDGNRREGRRPGYGYDFSPIPSMLNTPMTPHMNGPLCPMPTNRTMGLPSNVDDRPYVSSSHSNHLRSLADHDAQAMEAATRAIEEVTKRIEEVSRVDVSRNHMSSSGVMGPSMNSSSKYDDMPPCKRPALFDEGRFLAQMGLHSTHIKMTNRSNNGRLEYDNSMVVSMEINGMMYQGVLFAQHPQLPHHI